MNEEDVIDLCVFGYVRHLQNTILLAITIPDALLRLICLFHPRDWKFIDRNMSRCTVLDDGKSISNTTLKSRGIGYASVQFGNFFDINSKMIYKFTFKMGYDDCDGIGFITKQYNEFSRDSWCCSNTECMVFYINGYWMGNTNLFSSVSCGIWSRKNDEIVVKINTDIMTALVWNYTVLKKDDIEFKDYNENNIYQHKFKLPHDQPIGLIIDFGGFEHTISVTNQVFKYAYVNITLLYIASLQRTHPCLVSNAVISRILCTQPFFFCTQPFLFNFEDFHSAHNPEKKKK
eukprot:464633_1